MVFGSVTLSVCLYEMVPFCYFCKDSYNCIVIATFSFSGQDASDNV